MIKQLTLHNWKSFEQATLEIDPLTFIIGINASGKSNILDALGFLSASAQGIPVSKISQSTRGGADWMVLRNHDYFTLTVVIEDRKGNDLKYALSCRKHEKGLQIRNESLEYISRKGTGHKTYFSTDTSIETSDSLTIPVRIYQAKPGPQKRKDLDRQTTALSQMDKIEALSIVKEASALVSEHLKSIFIFNPIPNHMRDYCPLSDALNADGGNLAGVLAGMEAQRQKQVENEIVQYVRKLPEKDIKKIWAEKVGRFSSDAMLYCREEWTDGDSMDIDARSMSDGTLRFVAIVTALLTGKEHSLVVIEEVDNGLHPSRSNELVQVLYDLGQASGIDIICTTHNPVLIDSLGAGMMPFISYVKRSPATGYSQILLLEDKPNLAKLMAGATVGDLMTKDAL